ncbi:MAG: S8 family serine peptidase [Candidatus Aminicenantes bacterium]|nr:S8 family serine peptidase [Candidatus Aminicenantes bacterium]
MTTRLSALLLAASLAFLSASSPFPPPLPAAEKISPRLEAEVSALPPGETLPVWIFFSDKGLDSPSLAADALRERKRSLSPRCLKRRAKVRAPEDIVALEDAPVFAPYSERVASVVPNVRSVSRWLNAVSADAGRREVEALSGLPFVDRLEPVAAFDRSPDSRFVPQGSPSLIQAEGIFDFLYGPAGTQLRQINVHELHLQGLTGRGVAVCLLDSGFRTSHPAFIFSRVLAQWDFVNGDGDVSQNLNDPLDYSDSHGTGTWSALGAFQPGTILGPAFGADFILGKTETDRFEQPVEEDYWVAGLEWAEALGADVVSSSLGYTDWYTFVDMDGRTAVTTRAAERAAGLGVVIVNAAGNERNNVWGHIIAPADGFKVIAVGAVNAEGQISSFSSPGPSFDGRIKPEVCAMGVDVWLAYSRGEQLSYARGSGTSFAAPLAAGVAALLLEAHPDWTPEDVRAALTSTAGRSSNPDNDYGWGVIDALGALNFGNPARADAQGPPAVR